MADNSGAAAQEVFDLWRRQFEEGAQAWSRLLTQAPQPPADPLAFWRPVLDQGLATWARLFAQSPASPDLTRQWKQFLDQWIEAWSRVLGQAMNTDAFAQLMGRSLDQFLSAQGPMKKATEQSVDTALQTLNLASRSQLTGVARQIVELEERVERVEDGLAAILRKLDDVARAVSTGSGAGGERAPA
jgi:Poly(R)-hydroxyalkanoic acid synthase subunit (PHA_synth_III_E)